MFCRNRKDGYIGGVCQGISEYTQIQAPIVRLIFIFFTVFTGLPILLYFLLYFLTPEKQKWK